MRCVSGRGTGVGAVLLAGCLDIERECASRPKRAFRACVRFPLERA